MINVEGNTINIEKDKDVWDMIKECQKQNAEILRQNDLLIENMRRPIYKIDYDCYVKGEKGENND